MQITLAFILQKETKRNDTLTKQLSLTDDEELRQHLAQEKYGVSVNLTCFWKNKYSLENLSSVIHKFLQQSNIFPHSQETEDASRVGVST